MSPREKVIVGLMLAAVAYGAGNFLLPGGSEPGPSLAGGAAQDPMAFVAEVTGKLSAHKPAAHVVFAIEGAGAPWHKDPFLQSGLRVTDRPEPVRPADPVDRVGAGYTGFLQLGERSLAVIGGMEYEVGEVLENGGFVVIGISPQLVELRVSGEEETLLLPLQNP